LTQSPLPSGSGGRMVGNVCATPVKVALRMMILKHLHKGSFDQLEQEVRANLVCALSLALA
jgi:hypothetical protein